MMDGRKKRLVWAAGLSLLLIVFWSWRSQVRARHEADKALFQSYLQGPLSDLLYGVTRAQPVLVAQVKAGKVQATALKEAGDSLQKAVSSLDALLKDRAPGPWVQSLQVLRTDHQGVAKLGERWSGLARGKDAALAAYLQEEAALLTALADKLDILRVEATQRQRWTRSDILEINALLYSLRNPHE